MENRNKSYCSKLISHSDAYGNSFGGHQIVDVKLLFSCESYPISDSLSFSEQLFGNVESC